MFTFCESLASSIKYKIVQLHNIPLQLYSHLFTNLIVSIPKSARLYKSTGFGFSGFSYAQRGSIIIKPLRFIGD